MMGYVRVSWSAKCVAWIMSTGPLPPTPDRTQTLLSHLQPTMTLSLLPEEKIKNEISQTPAF